MRTHALPAGGEQQAGGFFKRGAHFVRVAAELFGGLFDGGGLVQNVAAGEFLVRVARHVAAIGHAVPVAEPLGRGSGHHGADFVGAPDVEGALALDGRVVGIDYAIGVFGGEEGAVPVGHIAQDVIEDATRGGGVGGVAGNLKRFQVGGGELTLVVEHLLEVRHEPALVHGIAVKAAAQLIVHAALGHFPQSEQGGVEGFAVAGAGVEAHEEIEHRGAGEFGRAAEAAVVAVEGAAENLEAAIEQGIVDGRGAGGRRDLGMLAQLLDDVARRCDNLRAIVAPGLGDLAQNGGKAGAPIAILRRKIGAAEEWLQFRREPHRHGPAAGPGGGLHEGHVDAVDVGALFAVHLDGNVIAVEQGGNALVLERFALHHMAPVAGGIPHRKEDRLLVSAGLGKSLLAPGVPIHGIVSVLEQVRTLFAG